MGEVDHGWMPSDSDLEALGRWDRGWCSRLSKPRRRIRTKNATACLSQEELEIIRRVVARAEDFDRTEEQRIRLLAIQCETVFSSAHGDGSASCVSCARSFDPGQKTSRFVCKDCAKAICLSCKIDNNLVSMEVIHLCKSCFNQRELWMKSGAWFTNTLPTAMKGKVMESVDEVINSNLLRKGENTERSRLLSTCMASTAVNKEFAPDKVYGTDKLAEKGEAFLHNRCPLQPDVVHPPDAKTSANSKDLDVPTEGVSIHKEQPEASITLTVTDGISLDIQTVKLEEKVFSTNEAMQQLVMSSEGILNLHKHQSSEALNTSRKEPYDVSNENVMRIQSEVTNTKDELFLQTSEVTDAASLPQASLSQTISVAGSNKHTDVHKESAPNGYAVKMKASSVPAQEPSPKEKVDSTLSTKGQEDQSVAMDGTAPSSLQPGSSHEHKQFSILTSIWPPDTSVLDTFAPIEPVEEAKKSTSKCGTLEIDECVVTRPLNPQRITTSSGTIAAIEHLIQDASLSLEMKPVEEDISDCDGPEYVDTQSPCDQHLTIKVINRPPIEVLSLEKNNIEGKLDVMAPTGEDKDHTDDVGRPPQREELQLRDKSYLQPEPILPPEVNKQINTQDLVSSGSDQEKSEIMSYAPAKNVQQPNPDGAGISTTELTQQLTSPVRHIADVDKLQMEDLDSIKQEPYNRSHEGGMSATKSQTKETNMRCEPLLHISRKNNSSLDDTDASSLPQTSSDSEHVDGHVSTIGEEHETYDAFTILWVEMDTTPVANEVTNFEELLTPIREHTKGIPLLAFADQHNSLLQENDTSSLPLDISIAENNNPSDAQKEPDPNECAVGTKKLSVQPYEKLGIVLPLEGERVQSVVTDEVTPSLLQPGSSHEHKQFSTMTSIQSPDTFVLDTSTPIEPVEEANKSTSKCGTLEIEECVVIQPLNQQQIFAFPSESVLPFEVNISAPMLGHSNMTGGIAVRSPAEVQLHVECHVEPEYSSLTESNLQTDVGVTSVSTTDQDQLNVSPALSTSSEVAENKTSIVKEKCDPIDEISLVNNIRIQTQTKISLIDVSFMIAPEPMFYTKYTIVEDIDTLNPATTEETLIHIGECTGGVKEEGGMKNEKELHHQGKRALDGLHNDTISEDVTTFLSSRTVSIEKTDEHTTKKEEYSDTQPPYQQPTVLDTMPLKFPSVEKGNTELNQGTSALAVVGTCRIDSKTQAEEETPQTAIHITHAPETIPNGVVFLDEMRFDQEQSEALVMSNIFNVSWLYCTDQQQAAEEHSQVDTHQSDVNIVQHTEAAKGPVGRGVTQSENESMQIDEEKLSDVKDCFRDKGELAPHGVDAVRRHTIEHSLEGVHQPEVNTGTDVAVCNVAIEEMKTGVGQQNTADEVHIHVSVQGDIIVPKVVDELSEGNSKVIPAPQHQHQDTDMRTDEAQKAHGIAAVHTNDALILSSIPVGEDTVSSLCPIWSTRAAVAREVACGDPKLHHPLEEKKQSNESGRFTQDTRAPLVDKMAAVSRLTGHDSSQEPLDLLRHAEHEAMDPERDHSPQHGEEFKWKRGRVVRRKKTVPKGLGDKEGELLPQPRPRSATMESNLSPISQLTPRPHSGLFESSATSSCQTIMQLRPHSATTGINVYCRYDPILQLGLNQAPYPNEDTHVLSDHQTFRTVKAAQTQSSKAADRNAGVLK